MAIAINDLAQELADLVAATWTDIVRDGKRYLRQEEHVNTIPLEALVAEGLPYAVLVVPEPESMELGLANRCYRLRFEAWWVGETDQGSETQRDRAESLAAALWAAGRAGTLVNGQLWPDPMAQPVWGASVPINQTLRELKLPMLAGGVLFGVVVGETP